MNLEKEAVSMGIIRAAAHAVGGGLADQWLEVIEPENMGNRPYFQRVCRHAAERTGREHRKRCPMVL